MLFQILGPGCINCRKLAENTEAAARELGVAYELAKVTDIAAMTGFGIRRTPALVADGEVVVQGRVPNVDEMMSLLAQQMA
jgi:small redox-active disulfide protein 2